MQDKNKFNDPHLQKLYEDACKEIDKKVDTEETINGLLFVFIVMILLGLYALISPYLSGVE